MGCCFSTINTGSTVAQPTAKVITVDGSLIEYALPVTVAQVLGAHYASAFVCNADSLSFDDFIPALSSKEKIELGQLYFMLPIEKVGSILRAQDMAALAVKASIAITAQKNDRRRRDFAEIVPVNDDADDYRSTNEFSVSNLCSVFAGKKIGGIDRLRWSREKLSTIEEAAKF